MEGKLHKRCFIRSGKWKRNEKPREKRADNGTPHFEAVGSYAIRFGSCSYFQAIVKGRIVSGSVWRAMYFASEAEAKVYAETAFPYLGMEQEISICKLQWVLIENSEDERTRYWNGQGFSFSVNEARFFDSLDALKDYQKEERIFEETDAQLVPVSCMSSSAQLVA